MNQNIKEKAVDELTRILETLEKSAVDLRNALIDHKTDKIWEVVATQEKILNEFKVVQDSIVGSNISLKDSNSSGGGHFSEAGKKVRQILHRVNLVQNLNKRLVNVYLSIIDKTFTSFNTANQSRGLTYGASGGIERVTSPLFVHQTG